MCPFDDDDPEEVKPKAISLWYEHQSLLSERETLLSEREAMRARIAELEGQIQQKNKRLFGPSSERRKKPEGASAQPEGASATGDQPPSKPEQKGHGRRPQPALEVEPVVVDLPKDDRSCDVCGGELKEWEDEFETSSEVDTHPKRYVVRTTQRKKYKCRCGACIKTAPAPEKLNERGGYSIRFGVDVATEKYADHKSLECQVKAMGRSGLVVDSQTLWDQVDAVAFWCVGAYQAIKVYVLSHMHVCGDETTWRLMENRAGKTGSARWWIWLARVQNAVFYTFEDSRSTNAGGELFDGFEGVLTCDGYGAYIALRKRNPMLILSHDWAHIRRAFAEVETSYPKEAGAMIRLIGKLFATERPLKDQDGSTRLRVRKETSAKLLDQIAGLAFEIGLSNSTQSRLYGAAAKMAKQWQGLTLFMRDARIPLHNNDSEQSARAPVLGRKNHQGSRSERGTRVAAILYTLCETAKLSGVEPRAYLHLTVLRAIRGQPPILPHEVTAAMLVEQVGMSETMAHASLRRSEVEASSATSDNVA